MPVINGKRHTLPRPIAQPAEIRIKPPGLHQVSGDLYCTKYTGNLDVYKHGFLRVSNDKRGMTYRDG